MKKSLIGLSCVAVIFLAGCDRVEFKNGTDPAKTVKSVKDRASKVKNKTASLTSGIRSDLKEKAFPKHKANTLTLITNYASVTPAEIIARAHKKAGGLIWARPVSLAKEGYAVYYKNGQSHRHESHKMWRVFNSGTSNAPVANGKVRIYSIRNGERVINISYDGGATYTDKGRQPKTEADRGWSSNFGFGVIRHALDTGYALERLPDDLIDGKPAFVVKVLDPAGGETTFGIGHNDYNILKVGFETARGWHERVYSDFYSNSDDEWLQPGRERLYYNGEKSNELIWERYAINQDLPDCLFILPQSEICTH